MNTVYMQLNNLGELGEKYDEAPSQFLTSLIGKAKYSRVNYLLYLAKAVGPYHVSTILSKNVEFFYSVCFGNSVV